jgi:hypothetical protein
LKHLQTRLKDEGETILPRIVNNSVETARMKWESGKKKVSKQKLEALLSTPETRN